MMKKISVVVLSLILCFAFAACDGTPGTEFSYQKESANMLHFASSDAGLDEFLNDYLHRHLRYDDYRIGDLSLGSSVMFNKEWEAMSLFFFDCTSNAVPDDRVKMMEDFLYNIPVDRFGYTWMSHDATEPGDITVENPYFGQGWPFPQYDVSGGMSAGWEFNTDYITEGWEVFVDSEDVTDASFAYNGFLPASYNRAELIEFVSPQVSIDTYHSPFLEIALQLQDSEGFLSLSNYEDVYVYWQTEGDVTFSEEKMVRQSEFATTGGPILSAWNKHLYLPMYLNPAWGKDNKVTRLKIEVRSKPGTVVTGSARLNYVRGNYDTRHTNNSELMLRAAKLHYEFTGKTDVLADNLSRYRQTMLFLLEHCNGRSGLIDQRWFTGHEGGLNYDVGASVGQGYWDILSTPELSFYTNVYFYKAIDSMAYLEEMVEANGLNLPAPVIDTADGNGTIEYRETAQSLRALQSTVRAKMQQTVDTAAKTGFWNPETGRFAEGFNKYGDLVDYGFVMFNLEAIETGIPTDEQARSIMDWISGDRLVASDQEGGEQRGAVGKVGTAVNRDGTIADTGSYGIYDLEFAPRNTTKKNYNQYYWRWSGTGNFGTQVQDGGAIMYVSYYDLMSRIRTRGADDAFQRLKEIETWYGKVKAVAKEMGVDGATDADRFYREYYLKKDIPMQGGGTAGGVGLDFEFLEAALLYAAVPYGFFGIGSDTCNVLNVAPNLPARLDWWRMENLTYSGVVYDLSIGERFVQVDYVRGDTLGLSLRLTLKAPERGSFKVLADGVELSEDQYTVQDGLVTVQVPFRACRVEIVR